jgi:hypothetical protein
LETQKCDRVLAVAIELALPTGGVDFLQLLCLGDVVFSPREVFFSRAAEFALFAQQVLRHARSAAQVFPNPS